MTILLGAPTEILLKGIGEDLKGKTQLERPYVDKETVLRALREQNTILLTLQEKLVDNIDKVSILEGALKDQKKAIRGLEERMNEFDKTVEKVEVIEETIEAWKEKMVLLDQVADKVEVSVEIGFYLETVTDLPNTIIISSDQVNMANSDNEDDTVTEIINFHRGRTDLLEESTTEMRSVIESHEPVIEKVQREIAPEIIRLREDVVSLEEWKKSQSAVDLMDLRESQDTLQLTVESVQRDLLEKTSREDVDDKLRAKFDEILDHLRTALASTAKDEEDFKAVTAQLNRMYETLKEQKADKAEIEALRKRFIENSIEHTHPSGGASVVNNEEIRKALTKFITHERLLELLEDKADRDLYRRLDQTDAVLNGVQRTIDEMLMQRAGNNHDGMERHPSMQYNKADGEASLNHSNSTSSETNTERSSVQLPHVNGEPTIKTTDDEDHPTTGPFPNKMSLRTSSSAKQLPQVIHHNEMGHYPRDGSGLFPKSTSRNDITEGSESNRSDPLARLSVSSIEFKGDDGTKKMPKSSRHSVDLPVIDVDRIQMNSSVSVPSNIGGGFRSTSRASLRGLDQYKAVLPVVEKKKMMVGDDGKYYVSGRSDMREDADDDDDRTDS